MNPERLRSGAATKPAERQWFDDGTLDPPWCRITVRTVTLVVGIDLGTTHSAIASGRRDTSQAEVPGIEQWIAPGTTGIEPLLPSFLFLPPAAETTTDPFGDAPWILGELARRRGREVPARLVSSAKSWLCHAGVDRTAPILPWGSDDPEILRMSPLEASARLLEHMRRGWDAAHPGAPLSAQEVVLTVPASFDEVARELTVRAARQAGLSVRLLEEPQAAFYDFIAREGQAGLERLCPGERAHVLVCDIGGGTTDLSLIRIERTPEGFDSSRRAVGRHLLLGGDNIDLALAHHLEGRFAPEGKRLPPSEFLQLVQQSRGAKEILLGDSAPESMRVAVSRAGSALVGATRTAEVTRDEVLSLVLTGFFPGARLTERAERRATTALVAFGLPYERDAAITRHLAEFLTRHASDTRAAPSADESEPPDVDAVLYNGGPFRSPALRKHLHRVLEEMLGRPLLEVEQPDPDLSVARGAVAFGRSVHGLLPSIASGAAHGYYVGVAAGAGNPRAVCVVPRGSKEGQRHHVDVGLSLTVGKPVRFELYARDSGVAHGPGELVEVDDDCELLPPLATTFEAEGESETVRVALEGELSAVGTVELACVESATSETPRRFRLAFELRGSEAKRSSRASGAPTDEGSSRGARPRSSAGGARLDEAYEAIQRVFGKGRKDVKEREVKDLLRTLEKLLGERRTWTLEQSRALFDVLGPKLKARRRSPDHERVYWMLSSFCLRPGFGHPLDPGRIALVASALEENLAFGQNERTWQQLFIAWRRLAAGLDETRQTRMRDLIDPFLAPASRKLKKPKGFKPQSLLDGLEAASWLERVPTKRRLELAEWILERTWTDREPRLWAAIGRLGTRVPLYASAHHVLPARHAENFLDHLLREPWQEMRSAGLAATQLARRTDDRSRDVSDSVRAEVARRLREIDARAEWIRSVEEVVPLTELDQADVFGEELPVGLSLV